MQVKNEPHNKAKMAVVGLGPGGLAAALHAASTGVSVVAFTNRAMYIRPQRIKLTSSTVEFLRRHTNDPPDKEDQQFWNRYQTEQTVQIKDLERFLHRKLEKYSDNSQIVQLSELDKLSVLPLDNNTHCIEIEGKNSTKGRYHFDHLLAADGIKRSVSASVAKNFAKDIHFNLTTHQMEHRFHAAVQLRVKPGLSLDIFHKQPNQIKSMLKYMANGWNKSEHPKHYVFANSNRTKFSFVGEIPESIHTETNLDIKKQKLKQWASIAIHQKYGIPVSQLEFRESKKSSDKNKLFATSFDLVLTKADSPLMYLHTHPDEGVFAQIGDARRTPYYPEAHGCNDAIFGGIQFASAIDINTSHFDTNTFVRLIDAKDKQLENNLTSMRSNLSIALDVSKATITEVIISLLSELKVNRKVEPGCVNRLSETLDRFQKGQDFSDLYAIVHELEPLVSKSGFQGVRRVILSFFDKTAEMNLQKIEQSLSELKEHLENRSMFP